MPLLVGERATRRHLSAILAVTPITLALILYAPTGKPITAAACTVILVTLGWTIAWRLARLRGAAADHRTYLLYTYLFCYVLLSGVVLL
jgi:hypothetical protein